MQITIQVKGLAEVQARFTGLTEALADPSPLTRRIAVALQSQIAQNAMSGGGTHAGGFPNAPTGTLASSFSYSLVSPTQAIVGSRLVPHYAPDVEFGHRQQVGRFVAAIGKRLVNSMAPAYPFVRPAIAMVQDKVQKLAEWWIGNTLRGRKT